MTEFIFSKVAGLHLATLVKNESYCRYFLLQAVTSINSILPLDFLFLIHQHILFTSFWSFDLYPFCNTLSTLW